jgi:hypothetical protein
MLRTIGAVAVVALLLAAGTAGAQSLFDGGDIKNNSLTGADLKNGSVQVNDLSRNARRALRGARGPRGRQGMPGIQGVPGGIGPQGAPGARGTTDVFYVDGPVTFVAPGGFETIFANCPPGSVATGGGSFGPETDISITLFGFVVAEGGTGLLVSNDDTTFSQPAQARAACARR